MVNYRIKTDLFAFGHIFEIVVSETDTLVDNGWYTATAPGGQRTRLAERWRRRAAARKRSFAGCGWAGGQRFRLFTSHNATCTR